MNLRSWGINRDGWSPAPSKFIFGRRGVAGRQRSVMNSTNYTRSIVLIVLASFVLSGCASFMGAAPARVDARAGVMSSARSSLLQTADKTAPSLQVTVVQEQPLVKQVLRKGQIAPDDGI